jgi:hypothetical protein
MFLAFAELLFSNKKGGVIQHFFRKPKVFELNLYLIFN